MGSRGPRRESVREFSEADLAVSLPPIRRWASRPPLSWTFGATPSHLYQVTGWNSHWENVCRQGLVQYNARHSPFDFASGLVKG